MALFICASFTAAAQSAIGSEIAVLSRKIVDTFKVATNDPYKNNIAVFDFENQGREAEENNIGATAASLLITELKKTGEFDLIDRDNLEKTIEEIKFSLTGLADEDQALEIGKIASANYFVGGEVSLIDDQYIINVRMTDVETGTILLTAKSEFSTKSANDYSVILFTEQKDPVVAGFRSALIPGWGQFYNESPLKGNIMLGLFAASVLTAGTTKILAELNYAEYKEVGAWLPSVNLSEGEYYADQVDREMADLRAEASLYYNRAELFDSIAFYSIIAYGGVMIWSVIDALVEAAAIEKKIEDARQGIGGEESSVEVGFFIAPQDAKLLSYSAGIRLEF